MQETINKIENQIKEIEKQLANTKNAIQYLEDWLEDTDNPDYTIEQEIQNVLDILKEKKRGH